LFLVREDLLSRPGVRILHFASERFLAARLRTRLARVVSVDPEDPEADVQADITNLPFGDREFDLIICSHVLERVPDDRSAMRELHRVLDSSGVAIVQSPVNYRQPTTFEAPELTDPEERMRLFSQRDHVRVYGPDLKDRFEDAGFLVAVTPYTDELDPATVRRCGLVAEAEPLRNDLYFCRPA
jgi:SAM-dependent methyltransferase